MDYLDLSVKRLEFNPNWAFATYWGNQKDKDISSKFNVLHYFVGI
jgi:hypothetical protein